MTLPPTLNRKHLLAGAIALALVVAVAVLVLSGVLSISVGVLGGTGDPPPQGGFHMDGNGGNVTIIRDVGGPVNATKLEVRVDGESRGTWQQLSDGTVEVRKGDRLVVPDVEAGDSVALYWTGGDSSKELFHRRP